MSSWSSSASLSRKAFGRGLQSHGPTALFSSSTLPSATTSTTTSTVIRLLLTYLWYLQIASTLESSRYAHQAPIYTNDRKAQNIAQSTRSNRSTQETYPNVLSSKNSHLHILEILQIPERHRLCSTALQRAQPRCGPDCGLASTCQTCEPWLTKATRQGQPVYERPHLCVI